MLLEEAEDALVASGELKPSEVIQRVSSYLETQMEENEGLYNRFPNGPPTIECAVMR